MPYSATVSVKNTKLDFITSRYSMAFPHRLTWTRLSIRKHGNPFTWMPLEMPGGGISIRDGPLSVRIATTGA